jgi:hypothetical protein
MNPVTSAEDRRPIDTIALSVEKKDNPSGTIAIILNGFAEPATHFIPLVMSIENYSLISKYLDTASHSLTGGTRYP